MKILYTLSALDCGGAEKIIYDYYVRMPKSIEIDFLVNTENRGVLEDTIEQRGSTIYHIPPFKKNIWKYLYYMNKIIKKGKYDIIHVGQGYLGFFYLWFAYIHKIKIRIVHAHSACETESYIKRIKRKILTIGCKFLSTDLFACGEKAAKWMWGQNTENIFIMKNAIDVDKFIYSESKRNELRHQFDLDDKMVIGNVGRLSTPKNHMFMLDVVKEMLKYESNIKLVLIGEGELRTKVEQKIETLGLKEHVLMLGARNDVPDLLNIMDVFLFPSLWEGLPISLLEVQTNGLAVVSSDNVTKEVQINENVIFLDLNLGAKKWAECILNMNKERLNHEKIIEAGYKIDDAVGELVELYKEKVGC